MHCWIVAEYLFKALRFFFLIYYVVTVVMRLCFHEELDIFKNNQIAVAFDYAVDAFFLWNFVLSFFETPRIQPISTSGPQGSRGPRLKYRKTLQTFQTVHRSSIAGGKRARWSWINDAWYYFLELMSLIPFELIGFAAGYQNFQVFRLFRFIRLRHYFAYWESLCDLLYSFHIAETRPVQRFWMLTISMAVISHVFACLFYRLGVDTMRNGNPHTWLSAPNVNLASLAADGTVQIYHSLNYRYLLAMYWSVQTLDTVGFGDIAPRSMPETFFCILFFYISGFLIYYSIANLMTIVMDADSARTSTLISKARFAKYAIYRNLPEVVCTRIENYYNYKYETLKGVDEKMVGHFSIRLVFVSFYYDLLFSFDIDYISASSEHISADSPICYSRLVVEYRSFQ